LRGARLDWRCLKVNLPEVQQRPVMAAHMFEDATQYRERAEEARQIAEKFINPFDKEVRLRVAGEWLKLAQRAEIQAKE